jgi:hypothetical protein
MTSIKKAHVSSSPLSFETPTPLVALEGGKPIANETEVFEMKKKGGPTTLPAKHPHAPKPAGTHRPHQRGTKGAHPKHGPKKTPKTPKKHPKGKRAQGGHKKPTIPVVPPVPPVPERAKAVKLPAFSTGQKAGEEALNGIVFTKAEITPEIEALAKSASTAKLLVEPSQLSVPLSAIKAIAKHPKSVSVGPNGGADWAKMKGPAQKWLEFMHDALMASIEGGSQLSPKLDPNTSGIAVKRIPEKRAVLDLVGEVTKAIAPNDGKTLADTKAAATELMQAMLKEAGQRAFEVVWQGQNGASVRAVLAIVPKTGEIRATALTQRGG